MANKIKPKRSYTASSVPLTTDLETHELAINWADLKAFTKDAAGNIVSVTLGGGGGSYTLPTASGGVLGGIKVGANLTITDGVLAATGGGSSSIVAAATVSAFPATGASGTLYLATDTARAYIWQGAYAEVGVSGGGGGSSAVRTFAVNHSGSGAYLIDGVSNPTLTLERGQIYDLVINASGHPFHFQTVPSPYSAGNLYTTGVTNSGTASGTIRIVVPYDAPATLYYVCQHHSSMGGTINVVNANDDLILRALFTPAAPTSVTATGGNAQVALTWSAPTVSAQTPITDYVVQFSSNSGSSWTTFTDGTSTATSATVTGLTNGTAHVFRVAAVNGVGTGSYSAASSAVTPGAAAVPVTFAAIYSLGNGSYSVTGSSTVTASLAGAFDARLWLLINITGTLTYTVTASSEPVYDGGRLYMRSAAPAQHSYLVAYPDTSIAGFTNVSAAVTGTQVSTGTIAVTAGHYLMLRYIKDEELSVGTDSITAVLSIA